MPEWQVALISAGAAILSSALTAYISHRLEWRRRRVEENLRWRPPEDTAAPPGQRRPSGYSRSRRS